MAENPRESPPPPIDQESEPDTLPPPDRPRVDEKTADDLIAEDRFESTDN